MVLLTLAVIAHHDHTRTGGLGASAGDHLVADKHAVRDRMTFRALMIKNGYAAIAVHRGPIADNPAAAQRQGLRLGEERGADNGRSVHDVRAAVGDEAAVLEKDAALGRIGITVNIRPVSVFVTCRGTDISLERAV
jgi:hypothetical protein